MSREDLNELLVKLKIYNTKEITEENYKQLNPNEKYIIDRNYNGNYEHIYYSINTPGLTDEETKLFLLAMQTKYMQNIWYVVLFNLIIGIIGVLFYLLLYFK